jgi:trimeric autotransporter adhesin
MRSGYSVRAVSIVIFLPVLFLPAVLTGQTATDAVVPLKNWAAPLYWQPNQAEREIAGSAGLGIRPMVTQLSTSALTFVAITPCRLVDTRGSAAGFNGLSPFSGPSIAPSTTVTFPVQSAAEATADTTPTPCGTIPSIAQAYSFNITVVPKTSGGIAFVTVWPAGSAQPAVSTLNDGSGAVLANAAIVPAGTPSGGVNVISSGPATTDIIIDMNGYYAATADITSVTAGTGLTESGTGGAVTLNLNTNLVPTLAGTNNFTGPGNFFTGGSVGVGTATPAWPLDVAGSISLNGNIIDGGNIIYQQPYGSTTNTAVGVNSFGGSDSSGTGNTASGYCAMNGNPGACSNGGSGNTRPMPRAPHAQGSGNNPHPDTSAGPTGSFNTAHGYQALSSLTGGYYNTALGAYALSSNTTAFSNTATGFTALFLNTTGNGNTATGIQALYHNNNGYYNTANGASALFLNTTGFNNTASGDAALLENTTGNDNTAIGFESLIFNTTGSNNIAAGYNAAVNVSEGNSNNIHIGTFGASADNNVIRIGGDTALGDPVTQTQFYASGIGNANVSGVPVLVNTSTGQLGIASSSRRFKEDIEDMGEASHDLMRLRPVTFRYKQPFEDGAKPVQYGLIAEEVAEVYPDLVARSADGQIETVKYQLLDPMLLNEVQRQHAEIGAQKEQLRRLEQQNAGLLERLDKLEAALGAGRIP